MTSNETIKTEYSEAIPEVYERIGILDGVRVFALGLVVWFHFWQQTWLTPEIYFDTPLGKFTGLSNISIPNLVRFGFDAVDILILVSAICNFLPYARSMVYKTAWPSYKSFYKKRAIRILPSYYFAVIIALIYQLSYGGYSNHAFMVKDIVCRFTMTSVFFPDTFNMSQLNGVLWTVQIEFWFYILIPWIALWFKKKPAITSIIMSAVSVCSIQYILNFVNNYDNAFCKDFILSYSFLYVIGLFIAMGYYYIKKNMNENAYTKAFSLISFLSALFMLCRLNAQYNTGSLEYVQLYYRIERGIVAGILIFSLMFVYKGVKKIYDNRIIKFLAIISYNFYIWHQFLAVWIKQLRIPYYEGDTPPNILGDKIWMNEYNCIIIIASLIVAIVLTYCLEVPIAKKLKKVLFKNENIDNIKTGGK